MSHESIYAVRVSEWLRMNEEDIVGLSVYIRWHLISAWHASSLSLAPTLYPESWRFFLTAQICWKIHLNACFCEISHIASSARSSQQLNLDFDSFTADDAAGLQFFSSSSRIIFLILFLKIKWNLKLFHLLNGCNAMCYQEDVYC